MATPTTSDFLVVPINGTDLIAFYRGSNISRPLYLSYSNFLSILTQAINANVTGLLLETNGVQNPTQTILNLIQGTGITITDDGLGGVTIAATGGTSFITSISDTADIDLDVTASDLSAVLTTTGVTPNTYGSATQVPQITVDSKGRITGVTLVNITAGTGSVTNVSVTSGTGISASVANPTTTPNITITNTAPDQTVVLNNGTGIAVTGTYPNFTITNTSPSSGGTVTAVTATSPITSSGGTAPVISTSMATNKLIGRGTAGTGVMEEITLGTGLSLSGTTLNATATGGGILHGTAAGTDTYTTTITGVSSYTDGDAYLIRFTNGNTTTSTLNINSLGAITLYRNNDGMLLGGDISAGGEMLCVYNSTTTGFQCIGISPNSLFAYVTNDDSVTITKGMPVYAFGGTGDRMTVKRAYNTSDATSAQTVGLVFSTSIAANQKGFIMIQGLLDGLSILPTSTYADGDPVYLGSTAGTITNVKPYAPNHLVYLGIVTTASPGASGRMYVRVQNGYELDELHNVQARTPTLKDTLWYDNTVSPAQWKTASIATILGYTPYPTPSGTTSQYVRGDGSLATFPTIPTVGNSIQALTGDVTASASSPSQSVAATVKTNLRIGSCGVSFDGGGAVITSGKTAYVQVPYAGTITAWTIGADISGSCTITAFKDTYANFPPTTTTDDIFVTAPALSSQQKNQNLAPTFNGSQATITAGDWIGFTITSITGVTWVNLTLSITKT